VIPTLTILRATTRMLDLGAALGVGLPSSSCAGGYAAQRYEAEEAEEEAADEAAEEAEAEEEDEKEEEEEEEKKSVELETMSSGLSLSSHPIEEDSREVVEEVVEAVTDGMAYLTDGMSRWVVGSAGRDAKTSETPKTSAERRLPGAADGFGEIPKWLLPTGGAWPTSSLTVCS